jgi:hypothetical protein
MQTLTLTPSLTLTVAPGSDLPMRIMAVKPAKKPAPGRSAKRRLTLGLTLSATLQRTITIAPTGCRSTIPCPIRPLSCRT